LLLGWARLAYNSQMRVSPIFEDKIRAEIRNEMARKPTLSVSGIREHIEKVFGRGFDYTYVHKLTGKVRNQISYEIDTAKIQPRLAELRENYRIMREELLKIVHWTPDDHREGMPKPLARDRVEAAKSVVAMDLAILQAEAAAGLYKKPIEEIVKTIHYEPLSGEIRVAVIAAWARGRLLPRAAVEEIVPKA
jgi:hypothetical protein